MKGKLALPHTALFQFAAGVAVFQPVVAQRKQNLAGDSNFEGAVRDEKTIASKAGGDFLEDS